MGSPISFSQLAQAPAPWMMLNTFIGIARDVPVGGDAHRHARHRRASCASEAVGVVAAHRAVERAAVRHDVEARARAARRLHDRASSPRPRRRSTRYLMAELLDEAGIPKGVVSVVPAGREVGEHLVRHPGVDKVAFTGSTAAGRTHRGDLRRAAQARAASSSAASRPRSSSTTPTSRATIEGLKFASLMNNGQACVAQTRILASRKRYDEVVDALGDDGRRADGRRPVRRRPPRSARSSPSASRSGSRSTSRSARKRARASSSAATAGPTGIDKGWYVQPDRVRRRRQRHAHRAARRSSARCSR